jgi:hypothetical protein
MSLLVDLWLLACWKIGPRKTEEVLNGNLAKVVKNWGANGLTVISPVPNCKEDMVNYIISMEGAQTD